MHDDGLGRFETEDAALQDEESPDPDFKQGIILP